MKQRTHQEKRSPRRRSAAAKHVPCRPSRRGRCRAQGGTKSSPPGRRAYARSGYGRIRHAPRCPPRAGTARCGLPPADPDFGFLPRQCKVRCATPRFFASRLTATASPAASARRPWSMVTAMSFGARLSCFAQRAARTSSAVESGPPETARINPRAFSRPLNSNVRFIVANGLFSSGHASVPGPRSASPPVKPSDIYAILRRATRRPLPFRRAPQSDCPSRISASGARAVDVVFRRDSQERFGGIAILLVLKQTFAKPILRLRASAGHSDICAESRATSVRRGRSPCAAHNRRRDRIRPWACCWAATKPAWRRSNSD